MLKAGNVTAAVSDFDRAIGFYTETLGLQLKYRMGDHWAEVATDGLTIGLHPQMEGQKPGTQGSLSIGFVVDSIDPAVAKLQERGVSFHGPVQDTDFVKLAFFADPDGNPLYLCEVKPAAHGGEAKHEAAHEKAKAEAKPKKGAKAKAKSKK